MDCAPQCRTALVAIRRMGIPGYFLLCYRHRLRKVLLKLRDRQRLIRSSFVGSLGCGLRASMPRVTRLPSRSRTYRADRASRTAHGRTCNRNRASLETRVARGVRCALACVTSRGVVSLGASAHCGLFRSTRTYLVEPLTTEAHHYMDYPQEAPWSGGFQSR